MDFSDSGRQLIVLASAGFGRGHPEGVMSGVEGMAMEMGLLRQGEILPGTGIAGGDDAAAGGEIPEFERLVGRVGWQRLAGDIRSRFSEKPKPGRPIRYVGVMQAVQCSWAGWLLAQLCRLIGTPFAPYRGSDVPVRISLCHSPQADAVIWDREYCYARRAPVLVRSTKVSTPQGLLECIGYGLGMQLAVFEANGELHFLSQRYFWRIGGFTLNLPHLLSPGTAHVVHADLGGGRFRFTMRIHHRLLGTVFYQGGIFAREGAAN